MFCTACGKKIDASVKYCTECGTRVANAIDSGAVASSGAVAAPINLSRKQIVAGLIAGAIGIWVAAGGLSGLGKNDSAEEASSTASTDNPVQQSQPVAAPEPARNYFTVASGAPICTSFKGAITAASVMRSGNPMAIDAVLTRQGCETNPSSFELEFGSRVQELQGGVVVIDTPAGAHVYTTSGSIYTNRH